MPPTKKFDPGKPRIEYEELGVLRRWPKNAKTHDLGFLGEAFAENGFVDPPVIDEGTGKMVEGHGRLDKLEAMRAAGEQPPSRVEVRGGKWFVPVIRGMTLPKPGKHVLAANRGGELGGWDHGLLAAALRGLGADLLGTGYAADDLLRIDALALDPWKTDIDVTKAGNHVEAIPGRVIITCKPTQVEKVRGVVVAALRRAGIKGTEVA